MRQEDIFYIEKGHICTNSKRLFLILKLSYHSCSCFRLHHSQTTHNAALILYIPHITLFFYPYQSIATICVPFQHWQKILGSLLCFILMLLSDRCLQSNSPAFVFEEYNPWSFHVGIQGGRKHRYESHRPIVFYRHLCSCEQTVAVASHICGQSVTAVGLHLPILHNVVDKMSKNICKMP